MTRRTKVTISRLYETLPRYMQRRERTWFRKGMALLKELAGT